MRYRKLKRARENGEGDKAFDFYTLGFQSEVNELYKSMWASLGKLATLNLLASEVHTAHCLLLHPV